MQKIIGLILPFFLIIVAWCMPAPAETDLQAIVTAAKEPGQNAAQIKTQPTAPPEIKKMDWPKPAEVKGVYVSAWMAGSPKWFPRIIDFVDATEVNAMVIDVKDDTGTLSYRSEIPLVNAIEASERKIGSPAEMIKVLREHNIYPIARIVVFKDPFLARQKPEWAVKDINGGLWHDRKGLAWVDPHNQLIWDYVIDIAKEAIGLGFQEIQFDYVRFTSDGDLKRCIYPHQNGELRQDVIKNFLLYTKDKLKSYNVPISADIFGLSSSVEDDLGIGQQFEKIIESVDIVCPMMYPSHYAPGSFGLRIPDLNPYDTVFRSMRDAQKRISKAGAVNTQLRPWLQDFSLGNYYGRTQVKAQIRAVQDTGIREWIFWNPKCRYLVEKYN